MIEHWADTYPHIIYASVLLLDNKIIDYKIGQRYWESPLHVTLRGQISMDELFRCETKHTSWEVTNDEEHNNVFENLAVSWIHKQVF